MKVDPRPGRLQDQVYDLRLAKPCLLAMKGASCPLPENHRDYKLDLNLD
jgi:hypothetical protein